ncbi:hypothetical protein DUNSADRAFT_6573 [Dunaliella salina]|nr:hypothetical protein DUNSADRAFT_6573 [Dunaliella salina]|eukprot:KAF5836003.1 hypothetical protein DUNSADRAFT_6573 [Dunaliella salina]
MFSCSRQLGVMPTQAPFINYVVCLGVVKGIQDAVRDCFGPDAPHLPIAIKWPNDIYHLPPSNSSGSSNPGPAASHAARSCQGANGGTADSEQGANSGEVRRVSTSAPGAGSSKNAAAADEAKASTPGLAAPRDASNSQGASTPAPGADCETAPGADTGKDAIVTDGASTESTAVPPPAGPQKIGGALIHTTWSRDRFNVVTGIGLNLSNAHPTTCLNAILKSCYEQSRGTGAQGSMGAGPHTEASAAPGAMEGSQGADGGREPWHLPQEVVLAHIMNRLDECFQVFEELGFGPLEADYLASWMHSGQQLRFLEHGQRSLPASSDPSGHPDLGSGTSLASLTIQGLSPTGFLMAVEESTGRRFELTPDGNSLDMMAGLIRRKLQ